MPKDLLTRINLDTLYPPFLEMVLDLLAVCRAKKQDYVVTYGFRSFPEQAKLYFQGRTTPGKIVTNAPPGLSTHNYGIAIDAVRDLDLTAPGLQPNWKASDYILLKEEGEKLGLQVGVPGLSDPGHVQLPLSTKKPEISLLKEFKTVFLAGSMPDVWKKLDTLGWKS